MRVLSQQKMSHTAQQDHSFVTLLDSVLAGSAGVKPCMQECWTHALLSEGDIQVRAGAMSAASDKAFALATRNAMKLLVEKHCI